MRDRGLAPVGKGLAQRGIEGTGVGVDHRGQSQAVAGQLVAPERERGVELGVEIGQCGLDTASAEQDSRFLDGRVIRRDHTIGGRQQGVPRSEELPAGPDDLTVLHAEVNGLGQLDLANLASVLGVECAWGQAVADSLRGFGDDIGVLDRRGVRAIVVLVGISEEGDILVSLSTPPSQQGRQGRSCPRCRSNPISFPHERMLLVCGPIAATATRVIVGSIG